MLEARAPGDRNLVEKQGKFPVAEVDSQDHDRRQKNDHYLGAHIMERQLILYEVIRIDHQNCRRRHAQTFPSAHQNFFDFTFG